ncbi:MAG: 23S rRNA (guanosine(2251)-2'-O)-methyltransferase RlmB [Pyrinomonadaceae bacterium]|nr:23S rRNA (guanosine(2251)-2'-O)-methyltransferase RlmB [Pyrinomonadaceae bacterium]
MKKRPGNREHGRPPMKSRPEAARREPRRMEREPERTRPTAICGVLPVLEALRAGSRRIDRLMIVHGAREHRLQEIVELARANGVAVTKLSREELERHLEPGINHQGVAAITSAADYVSEDEITDAVGPDSLLVILDGVEDPRNFGAILRTAECAGVDGVLIPERRAVGLTETVVKSSAGATEYVKVAKTPNINRLIEELKVRNVWVVGTSGESETDYTDWDWTQPSALVLGNEGSGLHRLVAENCDVLVKIPMFGKIDSLNVSVAAGVVLFEARRQRAKKGR